MSNIYLLFYFSILLLGCSKTEHNTKVLSVDALKEIPLNIQTQILYTENLSFENPSNTLGIGLIIVPEEFELFDDSLLTHRYMKWNMYSSEKPPKPITPKYYKPDYGILHFICIESTSLYHKILINESEIKYCPTTNLYQYVSWDKYILESFGIRRDNEKVPLRLSPNEKSETILVPKDYEMFCPIEIKGNWVKVKYDCFYNEDNNPHEGELCKNYIEKCKNPVTGWLKWRENNTVLIDIFLMP
jgi:hypothetical protein